MFQQLDLSGPQWPLARRCEVIGNVWIAQWSAIQLSILREHDAADLEAFKTQILRRHQRAHFIEGLEKLKIDRSLPPAVVSARYHYLSNSIGGLHMEYIEESPKKVWIRYLSPVWSFPDLSLAAVPASVQRAVFTGWHPFNGVSLGNPKLGFVVTKVVQEGEPYDEGYFLEYDHVLEPDERIQYQPTVTSPDFDPAQAPALDPVEWPQDRLDKARRNFAQGYVEDGVRTAIGMYGVAQGSALIAHAVRLSALVTLHGLRRDFGVAGNRAADLVRLFEGLTQLASEQCCVDEIGSGKFAVSRTQKLFVGETIYPEVFASLFEYVKMAAKMMSARIKVSPLQTEPSAQGVVESFVVEDVQERLF